MTASLLPPRRLLVPEVIQTSAMDCGPAVLKCLLEGFGIPASYGRLREACQTDVDGTSIDVLEEVAAYLGLAAQQIMLPVDHLLLPEADALPAIVVVCRPDGLTHFVLAWRRHGPFVQVMDPAVGRRWLTGPQFLAEVYVHGHRVAARQWREWAASEDFGGQLSRRLKDLGLGRDCQALIAAAAADPGWRPLARLDAAVRFVAALVRSGAVRRGREAGAVLASLLQKTEAAPAAAGPDLPEAFWSVRPAPASPDGEEQVVLRGAVLVRVPGRRSDDDRPSGPVLAERCPELAAALAEPTCSPGRDLFRLVRGGSRWTFVLLAVGLALLAGGTVVEALLFRGVIDLGRELGLTTQRLVAAGSLVGFTLVLLVLELRVVGGLLRLGRRLEGRLRLAFLAKIPRLPDRYFQSRPISDLAERSHLVHHLHVLPRLAGQLVRAALTLGLTVAALAWIEPGHAWLVALAAAVALGLPLALNPLLAELDLRVQSHAGALSRFYLDALLGLAAVRAHAAERVVRREHESLLVEWARASQRFLRWVVFIEGVQFTAGFGLAGWLLLLHVSRAGDAAAALLLAYWALNLPILGEEIALLSRQYPFLRNVTLRLLEPLGAPEEPDHDAGWAKDQVKSCRTEPYKPEAPAREGVPSLALQACMVLSGSSKPPAPAEASLPAGVAIALEAVTVRAAGQTILRDVDVRFEAGSHVAIVGASGAGKSSLVGLLLGWHRAAAGRLLIDGAPLDARRLDRLREETAWVEPAVRLWNRSLVDNLGYGVRPAPVAGLGAVLQEADLFDVLQRLPEGLQTSLGEGGGLLSGGEGQRVRLGRAFFRPGVRLVILDEPFRGLDRASRCELLQRARRLWQGATLLCITHDVQETCAFERVLVLEAGRVVEDDCPSRLAREPGSRYRALLDAEETVRKGLWGSAVWRRCRIAGGHLLGGASGDPR
jgi:ATP-binding cassette subfamily B protein